MVGDTDLSRLRGDAEPVGGTRGIARIATTDCRRHQVVIAAGTTPEHLLPHLDPGAQVPAVSPFAVDAGRRFEQDLLANNGARLVELYLDAGIIDPTRPRIEVIDDDPATAARQTTALLTDWKAGRDVPTLVLQARLSLDVAGHRNVVRPDVLALTPDRHWRIGELKSGLDQGGHTDGRLVAAACRQGAVGLLALAQTTGQLLGESPSIELVLRRDSAQRASLHTLGVDAEIHAITRALDVITPIVADAARVVQGSLADPGALERIGHRYRLSCHGTCALADRCCAEALARGDLAVLGPASELALDGVSDLPAATAVLTNPDHPTPETADLARVVVGLATVAATVGSDQ